MDTEYYIIELDRKNSVRMLTEVFFTDFFVIEHSEVVAAVEREAYDVEDDKVCVQTHDTVSLEIHQNLWIEGQGPEEKIDPSNDTVDNLEILRSYYFDIKNSTGYLNDVWFSNWYYLTLSRRFEPKGDCKVCHQLL